MAAPAAPAHAGAAHRLFDGRARHCRRPSRWRSASSGSSRGCRPTEVALDPNADGIVVLTGGASRINDAIELLAAGRGRRLLISGANRATNRGEILRLNPGIRARGALLRRFRSFAQHARQCDRDPALGASAGLPLADRGDVELSHAARHGRDRASASRTSRWSPSRWSPTSSRPSPGGRTARPRGSCFRNI